MTQTTIFRYAHTPDQIAALERLAQRPMWLRRRTLRDTYRDRGWLGPRFLYKYFGLREGNDFDLRKLRDVLVESEIFLASPDTFNDPFDFRAKAVVADFARAKDYIFRKIFETERGRERRAICKATAVRNLNDPDFVAKTFMNIRNHQGVCCFSSNPRSIPMWGHYGDSHRGICLQFLPAADPANLGVSLKVEYTREFPTLKYPDDLADIVEKLIVRKFEEWSYENEFRIVIPEAPNHRMKFAASAVTAVILGNRCGPNAVAELRKMLAARAAAGFPDVTVFRSHLDPNSYGMRLVREEV